MDNIAPIALQPLLENLRDLTAEIIAPAAEAIDREAMWPKSCMDALGERGFLGLHVPRRLGGLGQGLSALAACTEIIAQVSPSVAMCFGMHSVATAVIAAKCTSDQEDRFLKKIAHGRHVTSLALSESATGSQFYFPQTTCVREGEKFILNGTKQFVTNGGCADSYVVSTVAEGGEPGEFSCLLVEKDAGMQWQEPWKGLGMRGNSSRGMCLNGVTVPANNLLGAEGDQVWYIFEIVAPFFILAMAGTYLGISSAALEVAIHHARDRAQPNGDPLAALPVIQLRIAEMWIEVERTRGLVGAAALAADSGRIDALSGVLASKVAAATTAVKVTNEAMTVCGGIAYRDNDRLARLLRDARSGPVMSPTTDMLTLWTGRTLLGQPLL